MPRTGEPSKGRQNQNSAGIEQRDLTTTRPRNTHIFTDQRAVQRGSVRMHTVKLEINSWHISNTSKQLNQKAFLKSYNSQLLTDVYEPLDTETQLAGTSRAPSTTANLTYYILPPRNLPEGLLQLFEAHFQQNLIEGCCPQPCASILHPTRAGRSQAQRHTALIALRCIFVPTQTDSH